MRDRAEDNTRDGTPTSTTKPERKPYQSPRLVVYGDLPRLVAMAKPGSRGDGSGKPKTKL
jgi:hypothetical protein